MTKPPPKEPPPVELEPDAWDRFERFIKEVAKKPPQHRTSKGESAPKGAPGVTRKAGRPKQ